MELLRQARAWFLAAAVLGLLGFIPYIGSLFAIASLVCMLVSFKKFSRALNEPSIFRDFGLGLVIGVVGGVIAALVGLLGLIPLMLVDAPGAEGLLTPIFGFSAVIAYFAGVFGAHYIRKAYATVGQKLRHRMLVIGGNLMFWGAITIVVFGLGTLLIIVGAITTLIGFITLPTQLPVAEVAAGAVDEE
jgi:uncharacterized membrane protein